LKKNIEQFKNLFRSLIVVVLVLAQIVVFAYIWTKFYNEDIAIPFVQKGNWFFYLVYAILSLLFIKLYDGTKYGTYRVGNIITAQILALFTTAFIVYLQIVLLTLRFVSLWPILIMLAADVMLIVIFAFLIDYLMKKLFPSRKTVLFWDIYPPDTFIAKLKTRKDKFSLDKIINVSDGMEKIEDAVKNSQAVVVYDVHSENRNKILKFCYEYNVRCYTTTKVSDILVRGAESLHMFDTPLLLYRNSGLTFEQRFLKRTLDIVVSSIMLVLTSPILLISAAAIKLCDGGPVFFRQARGTKDNKIFYIHKFRSMIVDAEKDGAPRPAEKDDDRITSVGKVLRATRLDELPQLIDILIGHMSLVGPRPERIEHIKQYTEEISEFSYRLKIRGGLTGYAQLYGKYNTTPYDKLQLDLMYIQNYSILLDIKLILLTLKIMFTKESTEGFTEEDSKKINEKSKND